MPQHKLRNVVHVDIYPNLDIINAMRQLFSIYRAKKCNDTMRFGVKYLSVSYVNFIFLSSTTKKNVKTSRETAETTTAG